MANAYITDSPEFFALDSADQEAVIEQNFLDELGATKEYQAADDAGKEELRIAHKQIMEEAALQSQYNPANIAAEQKELRNQHMGSWGQNLEIIKESHEDLMQRMEFADDYLPGNPMDMDAGDTLSAYYQKQNQRTVTTAQKRLAADIQKFNKKVEQDGFWNDAAAWGQLAVDIVTNPEAVMNTAAESSSSITSMGIGAKAGSIAGPLGAAAGMFVGEMTDAGTAKFLETLRGEMEKQGYQLTPTNIQQFLDNNKNFVKSAQKKATTYGATLGVVDIATAGLFSKIATLPTRAARKAAMRSIDDATRAVIASEAKKSGKTLSEVTDLVIDGRAAQIYKNRSLKAKVTQAQAALVGEVASEPLSEAVATASIGEEIKAEDLIYETIGGIGAGPYGAAVNVAALGSKAGSKKAAKFTKKVMAEATATPEQKAKLKEQKATVKQETRAAQKIWDAPAEVNYKDDLKSVESLDDPRLTEWADPKAEAYNPIKAAKAAVQHNDPDAVEKIASVFKPVAAKAKELMDQRAAYAETLIEQGVSKEDAQNEAEKKYNKAITSYTNVLQKINGFYNQATNQRKAATDEAGSTDPLKKESTEQEVVDKVTKTLGSSMISGLDQVDTGSMSKETQQLVQTATAAQTQREEVRKAVSGLKGTAEVSQDIYHGKASDDFKGIDGYKDSIGTHLARGNTKQVAQELSAFKEFRDRHTQKLNAVKTLFAAFKQNKAPETFTSAERQAQTILDNISPGFKIQGGTQKLIAVMEQEVKALNTEVHLVEQVIKLKEQPAPTTKPKAQPKEAATPGKLSDGLKKYIRTQARNLVTQGATQETIDAKHAQLVEKRGENAGKMFLDQVEKQQKKNKPQEEQTQKPAEQKKEQPKTESTIKEAPIEVQHESAATMGVEYIDPQGESKTATYEAAIKEINDRIAECDQIINCITRKG